MKWGKKGRLGLGLLAIREYFICIGVEGVISSALLLFSWGWGIHEGLEDRKRRYCCVGDLIWDLLVACSDFEPSLIFCDDARKREESGMGHLILNP